MNIFHIIFLNYFLFNYSFANPIVYQPPSNCQNLNDYAFYFNSSRLMCMPCLQNITFQEASQNGLSCSCTMYNKLIVNFGGQIECENCPVGYIQGFSAWECVECASNCTPSYFNEIKVQRELDGTYTSPNPTQSVTTCAAYTAPDSSYSRCYRCDQALSVDSNLTDCVCNYQANGICFREQSDFPYTSLDTLFRVNFQGVSVTSFYFQSTAQAAVGLCKQGYWNTSACQSLANLCVMTLYSIITGSTCSQFNSIAALASPDEWGWSSYLPWIFYSSSKPTSEIIGPSAIIPSPFSFGRSYFDFQLASFSIDGTFLGYLGATNGRLQLCKNTNIFLNAAYQFGTYFKQNCNIEGKLLWDEDSYKLIFYDLWLNYIDPIDNLRKLYAVPISLTANNRFYRRFFLVDNISGKENSLESAAQYVRYAKDMKLHVQLSETGGGLIFPPYLQITYDSISNRDAFNRNKSIQISFEVIYSMQHITSITFTITVVTGVMVGLILILSIFDTWIWTLHAGQRNIDLLTLFKFILFACHRVSTVLFIVLSCGCSVWWLVYKLQNETTVVTSLGYINEYVIFISIAFSFNFLHILHKLYIQISASVFFIDWERNVELRVGDNKDHLCSSGQREYDCARRWCQLQSSRSAGSPTLRLFLAAFLLEVCGFGNLATLDVLADFNLNNDEIYHAPMSIMFRFAIILLIYLSIALVQWLFYRIFYERFIEDPVVEFVDYLSWANVSMVAFENQLFGYYIHGRSVHGRGDLSIHELRMASLQEEKGMCAKRGLQPDTDEQTFLVTFPKTLRLRYDQITQPAFLLLNQNKQNNEMHYKYLSDVHSALTNLFRNFIDQTQSGLSYIITKKTFLEQFLSFELPSGINIGRFYHDNGHSFDNLLMRGDEISLIIFEVLLFGLFDFALMNYLFDATMTYLIVEIVLKRIRMELSLSSIVKSTMLDKKFVAVHI